MEQIERCKVKGTHHQEEKGDTKTTRYYKKVERSKKPPNLSEGQNDDDNDAGMEKCS